MEKKPWCDSKFLNAVIASVLFIAADKMGCGPEVVASIASMFGLKIWKQGNIDEKKA